MTKTEARKRALDAAAIMVSEAAISSYIFDDDCTSDDDIERLRLELRRIADRLFAQSAAITSRSSQ